MTTTTRPVRARAPVRSAAGDGASWVAVTTLVVLPLLVYALPSLLGHPVAPGDDHTQNLPLRELVGRDIRHGTLPLFDPYLWSGAPLLAGWNAGAAYPLTWLFAVLPSGAAWGVNLASAVVAACLGTFAFLRRERLGVVASWLGALTYGFGGAMAAQVPHIGLLEGMGWLPLALIAVQGLTTPARRGRRSWARWTALLAVATGLVVLAGEPRAISNAAVVLVLYAAWRLWRLAARPAGALPHGDMPAPRALSSLGAAAGVVSGAALGLGLGAVQLLPGLSAVSTSQRNGTSTFLFTAGSLPASWLTLLGVPNLLGGSGSFGQPGFFAGYSLSEVTGYVGVLALVAAGALFGRLIVSRRPLPEWAVWYAVGAAGVVLALGGHTPVARLLVGVPLFGGQRLPSRSIALTDLALAVLLATWADGWLRHLPRAPVAEEPRRTHPLAERVGGSVPALAVCATALAAIAAGPGVATWMGVAPQTARRAGALWPSFLPDLLLALGALVLLWGTGRLRGRWRPVTLVVFVVADLLVFAVTTVVEVAPAMAAPARPAVAQRTGGSSGAVRSIAELAPRGRFALYDPGLLGQLRSLGVPDANALDGTYSVEGYGSIVDGRYAAATGVHGLSGEGQDVLAPRAAADGVLDELDATDLLAPAVYLASPVAASTPPPRTGPGDRTLRGGGQAGWWLGTERPVASVTLAARAPRGARVQLGLLLPGGAVRWAAAVLPRAGLLRASWRTAPRALGVVARIEGPAGDVRLGPPVVATAGAAFVLDGPLQAGVAPSHWRFTGMDGDFSVFVDRRADPPLRVVGGGGVASVARTGGPALEPTSARVVAPHGATVLRSVAAIPGWHATWAPRGGDAVDLPVRRHGVVEAVTVPPGSGTLTWRYTPPGILAGAVLSAASVVLLLALVALGRGRRRSGRGGPAGP